MKLVLAATVAVLMLTMSAASASRQKQWIERSVGQDIFNLNNSRVGRLEGYIDIRGTPGIIIAADDKFGGHRIIAPADDLGGCPSKLAGTAKSEEIKRFPRICWGSL